MDTIFNGVSSENIEKFFFNMFASDVLAPHTRTKLSPITFMNYLAMNAVTVYNQYEVYVEACKMWERFVKNNPGVFEMPARKQHDMEQAETPHPSWNMLFDYLQRFLEVEKISAPYFQMHYIAHVCNNFYRATEDPTIDQGERDGYRTIFNQVINPILYEPIVPARYVWLPIECYTDIRFSMDLENTISRIKTYINTHTATKVDFNELDKVRTKQYKEDIESLIKDVYANKFKGYDKWAPLVEGFFAKHNLYKLDASLYENFNRYTLDKFKSVQIIDGLDKLQKKFIKGRFVDEPDDLIDALLDVRPTDKETTNEQQPAKT